MHGADWDVIWLQRDFGVYIANLFDTGQAVRVLQHPRYGLGHMLERLCNVKVSQGQNILSNTSFSSNLLHLDVLGHHSA